MVGVDKNKLSDLFKSKAVKEEEAKKAAAAKPVKKAPMRVPVKKSTKDADAAIKAFKDKKAASKVDKSLEVMHSKTHQDLINAAYKAAEELKIAPWVLLRAAEWGHFTDDRGKKYDGPVIDDLKGLDDAQKAALKKAVGL
ncbi:MAG: hypothetical protein Q7J07_09480 [Pelolinea sp.]|nr:hypothetical protein [Pelolinea sp.]